MSSVGRQEESLKFLEDFESFFFWGGVAFDSESNCNSESSCLCLLTAKIIYMNHHSWHI